MRFFFLLKFRKLANQIQFRKSKIIEFYKMRNFTKGYNVKVIYNKFWSISTNQHILQKKS